MERIEMRDKSHRAAKKIQDAPKVEPVEDCVGIESGDAILAIQQSGNEYFTMLVSYLENNNRMEISHTEATILFGDYAAFKDEISKCRADKRQTFAIISKYSPVNRLNMGMFDTPTYMTGLGKSGTSSNAGDLFNEF